MMNHNPSEERFRFEYLVARAVDGDITPEEQQELERILANHPEWQKDWKDMKNLQALLQDIPLPDLPETFWDRYWRRTVARVERGLAWILLLIGAAIVAGWGLYHLVLDIWNNPSMPVLVRIGVLILLIGSVLLFLSVLHEKLVVRRYDRYAKEVRR